MTLSPGNFDAHESERCPAGLKRSSCCFRNNRLCELYSKTREAVCGNANTIMNKRSSIAAGAYYRTMRKLAVILWQLPVGGASNAFTGIARPRASSIPCLIELVSGQEKLEYAPWFKNARRCNQTMPTTWIHLRQEIRCARGGKIQVFRTITGGI